MVLPLLRGSIMQNVQPSLSTASKADILSGMSKHMDTHLPLAPSCVFKL